MTLTNVVLTDALTDDETYVSGDGPVVGDLKVDETWTYSASYTVTQADIDAGGNFDTTDPANSLNSGNVGGVEVRPARARPAAGGCAGGLYQRLASPFDDKVTGI